MTINMDFKREPLLGDEANHLANACQTPRERLVIWTLLDTGLRLQELEGLTPQNIDWQQHRLVIHGKGGKRRVVPMSARTRQLVEGHFATYETLGIQRRAIQNLVRKVAVRAGITRPCSPHVLRHTFAVESLKKSIDLASLQKVLGHNNLQTTAIYLNMQPEAALDEYRRKW